MKKATTMRDVFMNSMICNNIRKQGGSMEDMLIAMHNHQEDLIHQMMIMDNITPKKIIVDGQVLIFRIPHEFIPGERI